MLVVQKFVVVLCLFMVASCAKIAIMAAPRKMMSSERTKAAISADEFFWTHFHAGDYQKIDTILAQLKSAYLEDPRDSSTAALIGYAHAWRYAEKSRLMTESPLITDDAELARFYFLEAHTIYAKDPRILGFLADMTFILGSIHQDEKKTREGYFLGLEAIRQWPEFNLFTVGYVMSTKEASSEHFKEALDWQWRNLEQCRGGSIDRKQPDLSSTIKEDRQRSVGNQRACGNSWIAPHNFEGFLLNMGDMLLKAGEHEVAQTIYENARQSSTYEQWPYRHVLEQRLLFARTARPGVRDEFAPKPMMKESSFSCMACHQSK